MKFLKYWPLFWILCVSCLQLFCGVARGAISERLTVENFEFSENGPWSSDTITYGYTYGRRSSLSVDRPSTSDWTQSYSYDSSLRLDSLTSPAGTFDYVYSGAERRVDEIDLPGSLEIDYGYTANDKRLADTWLKYGVTTKNHHGYTYNVAGWKTEHDLPTGVTATLDHDALGQLTDADDYNTFDFDYAYDDGWNLDFRKVDGVTEQFSTNTTNELTSSPLGSATYDGNGNLTDDGNTEYTYDHENRLTQTEWQTGADYWRESYTYDGLNRLREIYREHSNNGTTWTFSSEKHLVYDGMLVVQERDVSNNVEAHYTRGLDLSGTLDGAGGIGGILAREWSSNTAFYHSDAGGNVTRLVDSSGNVQATYQYDPYGDLLSQSGAWASVNPYLFSGKRFLGDGLYYYGYRFYNTDLQRWINKDPIGEAGGINLYGFVGNAPLYYVDPYGLLTWGEGFAIIGAGLGGAAQGAAINIDTAIPFLSPCRAAGMYRPDDPHLQATQVLADVGQTALGSGAAKKIGTCLGARLLNKAPAAKSPDIDPRDILNKTPSEIDDLSRKNGLDPKGPDPKSGKGAYTDPETGNQRVLSHLNADTPHGHVNNPQGQRLDLDRNVVPSESPEAHIPIKPE